MVRKYDFRSMDSSLAYRQNAGRIEAGRHAELHASELRFGTTTHATAAGPQSAALFFANSQSLFLNRGCLVLERAGCNATRHWRVGARVSEAATTGDRC